MLTSLLCIAASHALRGPAVHRPRRLAPRRATALDKIDAVVDNTLNKTRSWGPARQAGVVLATYAAHAGALGRGSVLLPYQLVPNEFGLWQSVGYDSLLGSCFLGLHVLRRRKGTSRKRELPPTPQVGKRALITTIGALAVAYRWSGYVAALVDGFVYRATPTATPAMGRALQVLGGHLAWLVVGVSVLAVVPALEMRDGRVRWNRSTATAWYRFKWKTDWLWWVAGGYCASALIFNVADGLNHFLVPPTLFDDDTLVTKMVNPDEGRGVASILVGGVAPCVTAPCVGRAELSKFTARLLDGVFAHRWWEEVLYRGFLLRALERLCGRADVATVVSSCVESTSELGIASMAWGARNLISTPGIVAAFCRAPPVADGSAAARGARRDVVLPVPGVGELARAGGDPRAVECAGVRWDCARVVSSGL